MNHKMVTAEDLGMTDDEFSNFMIDCMELLNMMPMIPVNVKNKETGESFTITIDQASHFTNPKSKQ